MSTVSISRPWDVTGSVLVSFAREANQQTNDPQEARAIVVARIKADREVYEQLADELLERAVGEVIYQTRQGQMRQVKGKANPTWRNAESASLLSGSILTLWLVGSKTLGECTADDLRVEAKAIGEQERGLRQKRSFYAAVIDTIGTGTVCDALSPEEADAMWTRFSKAK